MNGEPVDPTRIEQGVEFTSARRTVTEADIINYAGLSGDFNPLHVDAVFAREASPFGERIAHGQLIASIVTGLASELDLWPVISYLGASRSFVAPVAIGDTISARYRVTESRRSGSRKRSRVVTLALDVTNQRGETVMTGEDVMLVRAGEASPG